MIKRLLIIVALATIALGLFPLVWGMQEARTLSGVARYYVVNGAEDYGAANLVTAVVVSYRGLDTLGEVAVLFVATAGIVLLLGSAKEPVLLDRKSHAEGESEPEPDMGTERREGSPLLKTGAALLFPIILLFGVYIFVNGHLTPGGGFQGGVVIASAVVLLLMANSEMHMKHGLLNMIEALSGATYVAIGLLGMWLAAGFLDPRFLPSGEFGALFSAGAIPLIYSLIGMKVGSELTGVMESLRRKA